MKVRFIIPFIICIVMMIGSAGAVWGNASLLSQYSPVLSSGPYKQLTRMDELASSLYQAAYTNNRQAGYVQVQQLQRILEGELKYSAGMPEGWRVMEQDARFIEQTLISGATTADWLMEAARLRLATDALVRPEHALWLQYENIMLDDLSRVEKAWKRQTGDGAIAARAAMNSLQKHAERIEPSIAMMYGIMHGSELMERIRYTNQLLESKSLSALNADMVTHSLKSLKEAITRVYDQGGRADVLPAVAPLGAANPLSWTLFLGAIISAVLTYSGWRKYKTNPFGVKPLS
ncbi:sporulation protein YpjB [Paenibacillus alkaliterrae]|uniref:sporulation protein YpjB n=1 Tax=Paenibacillus alkaliterrae TaxID=320909 RepID=UPI001F220D57|nr:sporulation protein YpjB [Paenibacillus alkaliterrae]MCF2937633.1 sporulation protein YpjB [Paenibacillus alkaliterrae]